MLNCTVIYEDELIRVREYDREYDFIAVIENLSLIPLSVEFINELGVPPLEPIRVDIGDWVGILADYEGREQVEAIKKRCFGVFEDVE